MKKNYIYYILVVAFFIRIMALNQSFWLDEATTATVARDLSWSQYFNNFLPGDFHPPAYYVLIKIWGLIFGVNEPSLRFLSIIFALISVYLIYKITKILINKSTALLAAILLSFAPLHIYYSQEARVYTMATALSALLIYTYLLFKKKQTMRHKIFFIISTALIFYTNYLSILMIVPIFLDYYRSKKDKRLNHASIQVVLSTILITAPLFYLIALPQLNGIKGAASGTWAPALGQLNAKNILLIPVKFIIGRINFNHRLIYTLMVAIPAGLYSYLIYKSKPINKKNRLIADWLVLPLVIGTILSIFVPVLSYFRFIFVLPALYILLAVGLSKLKDNQFLPILLVVLIFNLYFSYRYLNNPRFYREDWRGFVAYINEVDEDPTVVFPGKSQQEAFNYYSDLPVSKPENISQTEDRVWLIRYAYDISDPADSTRKKIDELGYKYIDQKDFNGVIIWEYKK